MTNRTVREAKGALLGELGKHLRAEGFPARPSGYSFRKKTEFGSVAIHLNIAEYEDEFSAAVHVSVRFDAVEDLVNACPGPLPLSAAESKKTSTVGCELGNLKEGRRREWRVVVGHSDIPSIAKQMAAFACEWGLSYFRTFSSIEALYAVLSSDDPAARIHSLSLGRAQRAIAAAFLVGGKQEAASMINKMRLYMNSVDVRYSPIFESFVTCFKKQVSIS